MIKHLLLIDLMTIKCDKIAKIEYTSHHMKGCIPAKYTPYVFAFFMAGIMAFLMSAVLVAVNTGLANGYVWRVVKAYVIAFPIAFCCVIVVRPIVMKIVNYLIKQPK